MQESAQILYEDATLHEECSPQYSSGLVVDPGMANRSKCLAGNVSSPEPSLCDPLQSFILLEDTVGVLKPWGALRRTWHASLKPYLAAGLIKVAPDGSKVAVVDATGSRVAIYCRKTSFKRRSVTFAPPSPTAGPAKGPPPRADDAAAAQRAQHLQDAGDTIQSCSWSPDSQLLAVLCASSVTYIIDGCAAADDALAPSGCTARQLHCVHMPRCSLTCCSCRPCCHTQLSRTSVPPRCRLRLC
jgi:hypothetical protein